MLSMIEDIKWLRIHREVIDQARLCEQCLQSGKNLKYELNQKQIGKLPEVKEQNEEVRLDFAGPFQNAKEMKNVPVSIYRPFLIIITSPDNEKSH